MIRRYIVFKRNDVNHYFAPQPGGPDAAAPPAFARTRATVGRGVAGDPGHGSVPHLESSRAIEARGNCRCAARRQERLLRAVQTTAKWSGISCQRDGAGARAGSAGDGPRSHRLEIDLAKTAGQDAGILR